MSFVSLPRSNLRLINRGYGSKTRVFVSYLMLHNISFQCWANVTSFSPGCKWVSVTSTKWDYCFTSWNTCVDDIEHSRG